MNQPDNQTRARRLAELEQEVNTQDQENRDAREQCARLEEKLASSGAILSQRKQELTEAMMREQDLEQYFKEDWDLGLSDLNRDLGLEERARQAVSKVQASARGRTAAEMGEAISSNYQRYRSSLSNYH